jgi:TMEM175 potassium channel family protein
VDTGRLETFSDGVFAIAITLLILDVRVPSGPESLSHRLLETWPNYLAYVSAF